MIKLLIEIMGQGKILRVELAVITVNGNFPAVLKKTYD